MLAWTSSQRERGPQRPLLPFSQPGLPFNLTSCNRARSKLSKFRKSAKRFMRSALCLLKYGMSLKKEKSQGSGEMVQRLRAHWLLFQGTWIQFQFPAPT